jgi:hypothetical protein
MAFRALYPSRKGCYTGSGIPPVETFIQAEYDVSPVSCISQCKTHELYNTPKWWDEQVWSSTSWQTNYRLLRRQFGNWETIEFVFS